MLLWFPAVYLVDFQTLSSDSAVPLQRMRRVAIVVVVLAIVGVLVWSSTPQQGSQVDPGAPTLPTIVRGERRPDPKTMVRGSIAGTVTTASQPLAGARVCAIGSSLHLPDEVMRDPTCATSDASGRYQLRGLLPARYQVNASARTYRPATHRSEGLVLGRGEHRTGVDVELRAGGVEVTGVVSDLTGGPIAGAWVSGFGPNAGAVTPTDEAGRFTLWVRPGGIALEARADGYAESFTLGRAPGTIDVALTPESTLSGIVVDAASGQRVEGAHVSVYPADGDGAGGRTFSDASGTFRFARLAPGRQVVVARATNGYGRSEGSVLAGLGQHVDGVVVKLHPAVRVTGKVVVSSTQQVCTRKPDVLLRDAQRERWVRLEAEPDGTLWADGALPGTYSANVRCDGFTARERYPQVVIGAAPVQDLVWLVDPGATLRGRVLARGLPVEDASVNASGTGLPTRNSYGHATTDRDGTYVIAGLVPGPYKLSADTDVGHPPRDGYDVDVPATGATKDLVVEEGGAISGAVVDEAGRPLEGVDVMAHGNGAVGSAQTGRDGAFTIVNLRPGLHRVVAQHGWVHQLRKPGATDDDRPGERATVRAGATVHVRLVVEVLTGVITGTVVDHEGKPVTDAFVTAARESDAAGARGGNVGATRWSFDGKPTLTSTDGTFTIGKLGPGNYTLLAQRRGGGEAITEHVAVGTTARLQLREVGSLAGRVTLRGGAVPIDLSIDLHDVTTGLHRHETYFRTGGAFVIRDLPRGKFQLSASGDGAQADLVVELAAGETKSNVTITLDAPVAVKGRVVELGTQKPVAGMVMTATLARSDGRPRYGGDDDRAHITDANGRFTLARAPVGTVILRGWPADTTSEYLGVTAIRTLAGAGTIDVGDLPIVKPRVGRGEARGLLGINFAEQAPDTPPEKHAHVVSFIDPAGPAAKTALTVGDTVVTIDGVDIRGANSGLADPLMRARPGTQLALGLARGVTIHVVLAAP